MAVRWETSPEPSRGTGTARPDEVELAATLRENPDKWARMRDFDADHKNRAGNLAMVIRQGKRGAFRVTPEDHGVWEAAARRVPDTTVTAVYVRYATLNND